VHFIAHYLFKHFCFLFFGNGVPSSKLELKLFGVCFDCVVVECFFFVFFLFFDFDFELGLMLNI
jgi:hypothetical protein